ncbi:MAG: Eco57I restriction-modification methylase domain-containing protein [Roseiflexaceae bacterium]|nr:Eco57I restriction-modification methylase domain-containing protein [Roseiflexaceae bacterium]
MVIYTVADLLDQVEAFRLEATRGLDPSRRSEFGQFLTPTPVARLMASMLPTSQAHLSLLDAGAGVGSLLSAAVAATCARADPPSSLAITAYEIDPVLLGYLATTLQLCEELCRQNHIRFTYKIVDGDFIEHATEALRNPLLSYGQHSFSAAMINPPYRKIRSDSRHRQLLRQVGIETSNLYTGFTALAMQLLEPLGQLVAITPRSFCNGPYFRPFRALLLQTMALRHIHVFESREEAFQGDDVLQENIIVAAQKVASPPDTVTITTSARLDDDMFLVREVPYKQVVHPDDEEQFIRLVADDAGQQIAQHVETLGANLSDIGMTVSTGRVVDFRAEPYLRKNPTNGTIPLIYPTHLAGGRVVWPRAESKKPNALIHNKETEQLVVPQGCYVLVKRFSSKEERRRVTAAVYDAHDFDTEAVGFENHLNYYHAHGQGIDQTVAYGLAAFLNSTVVDTYFRQFNGHTQVNATDLRKLRYPTLAQLGSIGERVGGAQLSQRELDRIVGEVTMTDEADSQMLRGSQRINEAIEVLRALGLPRAQLNERSALTLLALLDLPPDKPWSDSTNPLCGITPMMEFFKRHYRKEYKPNTRETVRRQTVHQFLNAGLIVANPDAPARPVNSPKAVYQIEQHALALIQTYGLSPWEEGLNEYTGRVKLLRERYAQERAMLRLPVTVGEGQTLTLSPGGQNVLVKLIIDEFASRFVPGGTVLYVGDTDQKFAYFAEERLRQLQVTIEAHGKMPDVVIYFAEKNWLVLIEAVTSHGPIDPKRRDELAKLFGSARAGLVYVTAFVTRQDMKEYLPQISWETEVWVAESPSHLIHFNGERFLGPA